jgi:outer membrane lipoprotein LolB
MLRRVALQLTLALLAACSSVPRAPADGEVLSGRLSVRVEGAPGATRTVSAAFELSGTPSSGRLDLTSPLGSVMARARWAPGEVVMSTTDATTSYPNLDSLTREVLGESLPVAALFDWLRGRPWSGAPSQRNAAQPGFSQLGWDVSLARFDEGWVSAVREKSPAVTVRAHVDK